MELKEWNQYSKEEKKELLNHWWYYYGKDLYTLEELENFNKLIDTRDNSVLNIALVSFLRGDGNGFLLFAMRQNKAEDLLNVADKCIDVSDRLDKSKAQESYNEIYNLFMDQVVKTYNNPEPAVPMSEEELANQILNL